MPTRCLPMSDKISRKNLMGILTDLLVPENRVGFEAYGRKVCAYIGAGSSAGRAALERLLAARGCRIRSEYSPGGTVLEVENLSYFKAHGWDA